MGTYYRIYPQKASQLFAVMSAAALHDATPADPGAKQELVARMHVMADRSFRRKNSLSRLMAKRGGTLNGIFGKT